MSKETFEAEWVTDWYELWVWERYDELITKHGGRIVWPSEPKEPPPPAVCTCPEKGKGLQIPFGEGQYEDFDYPGLWHSDNCALYVPF